MKRYPCRIVVVESGNPIDVLRERSEISSLLSTCRLLGHEAMSLVVRSRNDLTEVAKYIASVTATEDDPDDEPPYVVHVSCHGNHKGLGFGADFLSWVEFAGELAPLFANESNYPGPLVLVLSACGAVDQIFTSALAKLQVKLKSIRMPAYVFVVNEKEVGWDDALVSWIILYHQFARIDIRNKLLVQSAVARVKAAASAPLKYFRWDEKTSTYKIYVAK